MTSQCAGTEAAENRNANLSVRRRRLNIICHRHLPLVSLLVVRRRNRMIIPCNKNPIWTLTLSNPEQGQELENVLSDEASEIIRIHTKVFSESRNYEVTHVNLMSRAYGCTGRHEYSCMLRRRKPELSHVASSSTEGGNVTVIRPTGTARSSSADAPPRTDDSARSNYERKYNMKKIHHRKNPLGFFRSMPIKQRL